MKNSKTKERIFILLLISGILLVLYWPDSDKVKQNGINSEKLEIGMHLDTTLSIMGPPDDIRFHAHNKSIKCYFYQPPSFAAEGIEFEVDTMIKRIVKIELYAAD